MTEPTKGFREACLEILGQYHDYLAYQVYDRELSESDYNAMLNSHQAISAIQDLVLELIGEDEKVPERGGTGPAIARAVDDRIERIKSANNLRQALRERVKSE